MNLAIGITVLVPTLLVVFVSDGRLMKATKKEQLRMGLLLFLTAIVMLVGAIVVVPAGSLSDVPVPLKPMVDHILYLALSPVIGVLFVSLSSITRSLWRWDQKAAPKGS